MYLQLPISLPKVTNFYLSTIILMFDKQKKICWVLSLTSFQKLIIWSITLCSLYTAWLSNSFVCSSATERGIEKLFSQYWPKCCLENISSHMVEHWTFTYFFFFFHIIVKRQTHNQVHINFSIHTFMAYRICTTF